MHDVYISTATVEEAVRPKKMSFEEAVVKYNCISVDEFFDNLEKQIEEGYKSTETSYSKNFVDMVLQAEDGIKKGKGKKLLSEEFDNLMINIL